MRPVLTAWTHQRAQVRLLLHAPSGTCFLGQAVLSAVQRSEGSATWPACRAELLGNAFWSALAAHNAGAASSEQVWVPACRRAGHSLMPFHCIALRRDVDPGIKACCVFSDRFPCCCKLHRVI